DAWAFKDGWARVNVGGKTGFLNRKGAWEIPPKYLWAQDFVGDRAIAGLEEGWGVMNRKGEILLPFKFKEIRPCAPDLYFVWPKKGKGYATDLKGNKVPFDSEHAFEFDGPLAKVFLGKAIYGYMDREGTL